MADFLTDTQIADLKEIFSRFDPQDQGQVEASKIEALMASLGYEITAAEIQEITNDTQGGHGVVDFPDFLSLAVRKIKQAEEALVESIKVLDKERSGQINASLFRDIMTNVGNRPFIPIGDVLSEQEVDDLLAYAHIDENGNFMYEDFVKSVLYR